MNDYWLVCGGPTRRQTAWHADGYTLTPGRDGPIPTAVKAGAYRPKGLLWFATADQALADLQASQMISARLTPGADTPAVAAP